MNPAMGHFQNTRFYSLNNCKAFSNYNLNLSRYAASALLAMNIILSTFVNAFNTEDTGDIKRNIIDPDNMGGSYIWLVFCTPH